MKEIDKKDLPAVGGGVWNDDGCMPFPDPLAPPKNPLAPEPDPTEPLRLDV